MSRLITMKCPKCGGIYLKDGRCETCGYLIMDKPALQNQPVANQTNANESVGNPSNLIVCPDCGKKISKSAIFCPQCGRPFKALDQSDSQPKVVVQKKSGIGFLGLLLAIVIGGLTLWYIAAPYSTPVWLQQIGGTIRCFFTGETSYKVFDPTGVLKK